MDWADELAARVSGPQVVNDSKTPSGTVHVGSLRGPVILDVITRALRANGHETTLLYGVDDMDPMDAQALLTPDAIDREMGRPLAHVPDPTGDGHASYARHFASIFVDIFAGLGIHPDRYYWMSDIYPTGAMDPYIRIALDRAALVREIYRRVANVQHPDTWHPLGVVCPTCGKVGTTIVTDWDGEKVFYECRADLVTWARGCGSSGWISPFGGAAKLPWNLEWAAQWSLFGVTIEPGGKDLSTAGGSRDRSDAIAREVYEREPPLNVPYEFLNIGGKKMSTSKGKGAAAHTIAEVIPPEQLRFLFVRPRPNQAIEFDPDGTDAIPRLFDEFDKFAAATAGREVKGEIAARLRGHLPLLAHRPRRGRRRGGGPLPAGLRSSGAPRPDPGRRCRRSHRGREGQSVDRARGRRPRRACRLRARVARDLRAGPGAAERPRTMPSPTRWPPSSPTSMRSSRRWRMPWPRPPRPAVRRGRTRSSPRPRRPTFRRDGHLQRSTSSFLGRTNGPRAGWLLASLDPTFVLGRLREAAGTETATSGGVG